MPDFAFIFVYYATIFLAFIIFITPFSLFIYSWVAIISFTLSYFALRYCQILISYWLATPAFSFRHYAAISLLPLIFSLSCPLYYAIMSFSLLFSLIFSLFSLLLLPTCRWLHIILPPAIAIIDTLIFFHSIASCWLLPLLFSMYYAISYVFISFSFVFAFSH